MNVIVDNNGAAVFKVDTECLFANGILFIDGVPCPAYSEEDYSIVNRGWFDLDDLREIKRTELKAQRDAIIDAPINNVQVARIEDRENVQGYLMYESEEPIEWVMADNTTQSLMLSDLQAVQSTYISRKRLAYEAYNVAVDQLNNATTEAEIEAIEVTLDA